MLVIRQLLSKRLTNENKNAIIYSKQKHFKEKRIMITDKLGNKYYKIGLHIHTTNSDGKRTPEEVAREYKADGFDAVAFTDHWIYGPGGTLEGLHIISGCFINSDKM